MTSVIGYDNSDNEMHPIELNEVDGFVSCDAYDWACDVTPDQIKLIKSGQTAQVMWELTRPAELDWFVLA